VGAGAALWYTVQRPSLASNRVLLMCIAAPWRLTRFCGQMLVPCRPHSQTTLPWLTYHEAAPKRQNCSQWLVLLLLCASDAESRLFFFIFSLFFSCFLPSATTPSPYRRRLPDLLLWFASGTMLPVDPWGTRSPSTDLNQGRRRVRGNKIRHLWF